jgi:acetolactate synthase-1/2/3 large subunit
MNLMISVANAYHDNSAFFVITGNVPTNQLDTGALQDDYRYHMSAMFTPVVKKSWRIRKVEDLVKALPDAFSMMRTGRPGPVHFDIPYDLYMRTAPVATPDPGAHGQPLNWRTRWPTKPSSGRSPFSPARKDRSYSREEACA